MKISFAYPYGTIEPWFMSSVMGMILGENNNPEDMRLLGSTLNQGGCYISVNRNKIVSRFLQFTTDDYLLMIDTDIEFPINILYQFKELLDENPDTHVIAGRANIGNGLPVFYNISNNGFHEHCTQPFTGLKEFTRVGTGIILISRHCLSTITLKYHANLFTHLVVPDNAGNMREVGDDFSFCERAKDCGFKIYGAWSIFGNHYKPQPIHSLYPVEVDNTIIK